MRYCLLTFMLSVAILTSAKAQEPGKLPDDYHTLVCDAAVDVDSPLHSLSLRVVEKRGFRDPKFDAYVRQMLESKDVEVLETRSNLETVKRLMPFCTIPNEERVRLLLDQLAASKETIDSKLIQYGRAIDLTQAGRLSQRTATLAELLQVHQVELRAELKKRLDTDHPPWILASAVSLLNIGGQDLLPALMRAAKSDDEQLQYAAIDAIDQLLLDRSDIGPEVRRRHEATRKQAEVIIGRYDKDDDARLNSSEWNKMLIPPKQADVNQDGYVTADELGNWIQSRSRQR